MVKPSAWRSTAAHKRRRAQLLAQLRPGQPCPRCGRPMYRGQSLDADHFTTPLATGRYTLPDTLAHSACNRRHGAQLTAQSRRAKAQAKPNEQSHSVTSLSVRSREW